MEGYVTLEHGDVICFGFPAAGEDDSNLEADDDLRYQFRLTAAHMDVRPDFTGPARTSRQKRHGFDPYNSAKSRRRQY